MSTMRGQNMPFSPALMPGSIPNVDQATPDAAALDELLRQLMAGQEGGAQVPPGLGNSVSVAPAIIGGVPMPENSPPPPQNAPVAPLATASAPKPAPTARPVAAPVKRSLADDVGDIGNALMATDPIMSKFGASLEGSESKNHTMQLLTSKGIDPVTAKAAMANPAILQQVLGQLYKPKTGTLKENDRLWRQNDDGSIVDITPEGGGMSDKTPAGRARLAPALGLKEGSPDWREYVANGKVPHQAKLPSGFEWNDPSDPAKGMKPAAGSPFDFARRDKINAAKTALDGAINGMTELQDQIKRTVSHGGFNNNFGIWGGTMPNIRGSKEADAWQLIEQLQNKGFLNAVAGVKQSGASLGPISNIEGERLTKSFGTFSPKGTAEQARKDLERINNEIEDAKDRMIGAFERQHGENAQGFNQKAELDNALSAAKAGAPVKDVYKMYLRRGGDPLVTREQFNRMVGVQ